MFAGLANLATLTLDRNDLSSLPDGVFAGLANLESLNLRYNPGTPFLLDVDLARTDATDPLAPGPATIVATVRTGAPFPMTLRLRAEGGALSDGTVNLVAGSTQSGSVMVTPGGSATHRFVEVAALPSLPDSAFYGFDFAADHPLVLANPSEVKLDVPVAYLVQAAQSHRGTVRLVAGRQALLRVFGISDIPISYQLRPVATFYLNGEEVHEVRMPPLAFVPTEVMEGQFDRSFNATIPGSVIQPGLAMVVELDPDGIVPQASTSVSRFETNVWVSELPDLETILVPVHFASDSNKTHNSKVTEFAQDLATHDETGFMWYVSNMLPVGDMRIQVRKPYVTQSDQDDDGAFALLREIAMLRFLAAGGTSQYYHGLWARPKSVSNQGNWDCCGGVAYLPGYSAISNVFRADGYGPYGRSTFAHELGHNLSLPHAPCGDPSGVDPAFPYSDGSIGTFGFRFRRDPSPATHGNVGVVVSPLIEKDVMSYCGPRWISDYNFNKARRHRMDLARAGNAVVAGHATKQEALLLWGAVRDGALRMEPAFTTEAWTRLPEHSGPYRLTGVATSGEALFQLDFSPDPVDHGGASFLFAVPFRDEWLYSLDRIDLTGPEGTTSVDRDTGGRAAMLVDESTGLVRSIVRDWTSVQGSSRGAVPVTAAEGVVIRRGLPRR